MTATAMRPEPTPEEPGTRYLREPEMRILLQYFLERVPHARFVLNIRQVGGHTFAHKAWLADRRFVSVTRRPLVIGRSPERA